MQTKSSKIEKMYRMNRTEVHAFVTRHVGAADADDITSEVFLEASRHLSRADATPIGVGWLMTVARRRIIDHWRRMARLAQLQERIVSNLCPEQGWDGSHSLASVNATEERCPLGSIDLAAFNHLPHRQQHALVLRYVGGWSVSEIGDRLGCSYQATESLLARGRRQLAASVTADHVDAAVIAA